MSSHEILILGNFVGLTGKYCTVSICCVFVFRHRINKVAVCVNAENDVQVPLFVSTGFPVLVFVRQWVMELVVKGTVPDGRYAPFEFCCFWYV